MGQTSRFFMCALDIGASFSLPIGERGDDCYEGFEVLFKEERYNMTTTQVVTKKLQVPQNEDEATASLAEIGRLEREIETKELIAKEKIAAVVQKADAEVRPLADELQIRRENLSTFAQAHRKELTADGKKKTIAWSSGKIGWEWTRPSLQLEKGVSSKDLLATLKALQLGQFVRTKEEPNRVAMLDNKAVALTVPGVKIIQREYFTIAPDQRAVSYKVPVSIKRFKTIVTESVEEGSGDETAEQDEQEAEQSS